MCDIVAIRFFKKSSEEEREHAEKFIKYQAILLSSYFLLLLFFSALVTDSLSFLSFDAKLLSIFQSINRTFAAAK